MPDTPTSSPPKFDLMQANYRQLLDYQPNVAILPWGATEAHNYHLPHGTDTIQSHRIALAAAAQSVRAGGRPIVLPPIPFGNNAQQLDQVATIHLSTNTAKSILNDIALSLTRQNINRLLILNGHGGNEFKPIVRDIQLERQLLIVVVNFWQVAATEAAPIFVDPGDHAGELETSLMLHLRPECVAMDQAGPGKTIPFAIGEIAHCSAWTPRPWSQVHPDTGAGDPAEATEEKGARYMELVTERISQLITALSNASPGDTPC